MSQIAAEGSCPAALLGGTTAYVLLSCLRRLPPSPRLGAATGATLWRPSSHGCCRPREPWTNALFCCASCPQPGRAAGPRGKWPRQRVGKGCALLPKARLCRVRGASLSACPGPLLSQPVRPGKLTSSLPATFRARAGRPGRCRLLWLLRHAPCSGASAVQRLSAARRAATHADTSQRAGS